MYKNKDAVIYYNLYPFYFLNVIFILYWMMFWPWRFFEVFDSLDSMRIDFRGSEPWFTLRYVTLGWVGLNRVNAGNLIIFRPKSHSYFYHRLCWLAGRIFIDLYFTLLAHPVCISSFTTLFEVTPPLFPPQIIMIGPPTAWNNGASYTGAHVQPTSQAKMRC